VWNRQDACSGVSCFINILTTHVSLNASWARDAISSQIIFPTEVEDLSDATHQGFDFAGLGAE
ncbi:MAG: hypothetical protein WD625_10790, partial [Balneolales bacterium]